MNREGRLIKDKEDNWVVEWSDMHSFLHGTIYVQTKLSPDSTSIKYLKNNREVKELPLTEGASVEFELITNTSLPRQYAKLVFPEVEEFEKEQYIKEYIRNGGHIFSINGIGISEFRDGKTMTLYGHGKKLKPFYVHIDNWTLHSEYPLTDENIITDKATQVYVMSMLEHYKQDCEFNLKMANDVIQKLKL
jgi:hypothetical protein